jgi:hypothetical protein
MNSIDGVLARIQEILTRMQEIRDMQVGLQGANPTTQSGVASSQQSAGNVPASSAAATQGMSAAKTKQFQQLLQQALAVESSGIGSLGSSTTGGTSGADLLSNGLGGLSNLTNLGSVLDGSGIGAAATTSANSLQQYQNELLQALQQLKAQKKQGSS